MCLWMNPPVLVQSLKIKPKHAEDAFTIIHVVKELKASVKYMAIYFT